MLVLSDLHAFEGEYDDRSPSLMSFGAAKSRGPRLVELCGDRVHERFASVDVLLLAGDIANQADPEGLRQSWEHVNGLASRLSAKLIATAGNHDYDSRTTQGANPKGNLLDLTPPFPTGVESEKQHYFTYDFQIHSTDRYLVATVNSAAQHGYMFENESEYEHGRIMKRTIDRLMETLSRIKDVPAVRVLLVHHHVLQLPDVDTSEHSLMKESDALMRALEDQGDWTIVHGHKHRGWVHYAAGGANSPVVVSASSFGARSDGAEFDDYVRRQFHVIEFTPQDPTQMGLGANSGQIHSWTHSANDWVEAGENDSLRAISGFGYRSSITALAATLHAATVHSGSLDRVAIKRTVPGIDFLAPQDLRRLGKRLLSSSPSVIMDIDSKGLVNRIDTAVPLGDGS